MFDQLLSGERFEHLQVLTYPISANVGCHLDARTQVCLPHLAAPFTPFPQDLTPMPASVMLPSPRCQSGVIRYCLTCPGALNLAPALGGWAWEHIPLGLSK